MRKARASLHQLARTTAYGGDDPSASWSSEEEEEEEDEAKHSRKRVHDDPEEEEEEEVARYRKRRQPISAPLRGPERFEDSALALGGRRHLFHDKIAEIEQRNKEAAARFRTPLNDGTYYNEENNYSGAFMQAWIDDMITRNVMLQKDDFYNFLSILATRLQVDIEETFDIDALDRLVTHTQENLKRRELDSKRALVTANVKKEQLELMRDLRWRERVEHDVVQLRYAQMAPHRQLAEVANAFYAEFKVHPRTDAREPTLAARPGVHVIDEFMHDFHLFRIIHAAEAAGRGANMVRLARSPDNRALAAKSPLYLQLTEWFAADPPGGVMPEGNYTQWIFTQPALRGKFRGLFLLAYFYLDRDILRRKRVNDREPYRPPLQYVHAAYRWVWERMLRIDPQLRSAQSDYLDPRVFWSRVHTPLDAAVRLREIENTIPGAIEHLTTLRAVWDWLGTKDVDPLAGLRPDTVGRIAILERIDTNLAAAREACMTRIHQRMLLKPSGDQQARLEPMLLNLSKHLAKPKDGNIQGDESIDGLLPLMSHADRDLIERLQGQLQEPVLERANTAIGTLLEQKPYPEAIVNLFATGIPQLVDREAELARSAFPFSFLSEATLREHLYYVTTDPEARKDRVVPRTQLSDREDRDPARQDAEESPKSRIQRVYARANRRALAAISGFGAYVPAKEGEPMYPYTIQQDPTLLPAVLMAETFAVRLYQVEHAAARLDEYDADILEIEGIIANIATERPALPDRDQLLQRYVVPSKRSVLWRMRPEISGQITVNPTIRALIESAMFYVRNANPALGAFTMDDVLREGNEDFMLAFIDCVVTVRNTDQLANPVAFSATITVGNVKLFARAAFQRIRLFRVHRVLRTDVAPPVYVSRFTYQRALGMGALGSPLPAPPRPFG